MIDEPKPGSVTLFGSGETFSTGRKVFDSILKSLPSSPRIVLLETPAGFELNSHQVINRVGDFIRHRLQNYQPQITIVPARRRGTLYSPDDPKIVQPLLEADLIFLGPGSPTYAVRQLRDSLAWYYLVARYLLGAALVLASASTVAMSVSSLPVYEIYKVGEDLHWKEGLNFFGMFDLPLVFIPHWNNNDGGSELDTSRCFMGRSRFIELFEMLPPKITILGIDENTALILDIQEGVGRVKGSGGITRLHTGQGFVSTELVPNIPVLADVPDERQGHIHQYQNGEAFPLSECCPLEIPQAYRGIPLEVWDRALETQERLRVQRQALLSQEIHATSIIEAPPEIQSLVSERQKAREQRDWTKADDVRGMIEKLGWKVEDTPEGTRIKRSKDL